MSIRPQDIESHIEQWQKSCLLRGMPDYLQQMRPLEEKYKELDGKLQALRTARNRIDHTDAQFRVLSAEIANLTAAFSFAEKEREELLTQLPNFVHPDTPSGATEKENIVLEVNGEVREGNLRHEDLPEWLYAKQAAGEVCGARASIFRGDLALLKLALGQWLSLIHI